jgi:hypothetical protein
MDNQHIRSTSSRYRLIIGFALLAILLVSASLLIFHGDIVAVYVNVLTVIAMLVGALGLMVYVARLAGWTLPSFLAIPEKQRDENWRLLALSLAAIVFPLLILLIRYLLLR